MPDLPRRKKKVRKVQRAEGARGSGQGRRAPPEDDARSGTDTAAAAGKWVVRIAVFGALAVAAYVIVPRFLKGREAAGIWDQAVAAHNAGRFQDAIDLYKQAREAAPEGYTQLEDRFPKEIAKSFRAACDKLKLDGQYAEAGRLFAEWAAVAPETAHEVGAVFEAARCFQMASIRDKALRKTALEYARKALEQGGGPFSRAEIERFIERLERKIGGD